MIDRQTATGRCRAAKRSTGLSFAELGKAADASNSRARPQMSGPIPRTRRARRPKPIRSTHTAAAPVPECTGIGQHVLSARSTAPLVPDRLPGQGRKE